MAPGSSSPRPASAPAPLSAVGDRSFAVHRLGALRRRLRRGPAPVFDEDRPREPCCATRTAATSTPPTSKPWLVGRRARAEAPRPPPRSPSPPRGSCCRTFTGVPARPWSTWPPCGTRCWSMGRRRRADQSSRTGGARDRPLGHRRVLGPGHRRSPPTWAIGNTSATSNATSCCVGRSRPSTGSGSSPRAPASATR